MSGDTGFGAGVGRAALTGAAVGFVAMAAATSATLFAAGLEPADAAGVGVFAAVWGGPGFGALFGAVVALHRNDLTAAPADGHALGASLTADTPTEDPRRARVGEGAPS